MDLRKSDPTIVQGGFYKGPRKDCPQIVPGRSYVGRYWADIAAIGPKSSEQRSRASFSMVPGSSQRGPNILARFQTGKITKFSRDGSQMIPEKCREDPNIILGRSQDCSEMVPAGSQYLAREIDYPFFSHCIN